MIVTIIISVIIVSLIGAGLAAVLVISERFIGNYGPCRIDINGERELTVEGGKSLLSTLTEEKIFIPSACGGRGTCGLCKLKVLQGGGQLLPTEEPYMDEDEKKSSVRLSCQVKIRNDMKIEIPPELFAIREYTCKCVDIIDLTHDIKQFRFELVEPQTMNYTPGQYVQLLTPAYEKSDEEVYRAYSISSDPAEKNVIELIIRLVPGGICTTYCFDYLKVGDEVKLNGPYGDFQLSDTDAPIVFIAGGSGMAPIKCMLHHMKNTNDKRKATYYFGANRVKELFLQELMKQFERDLSDFEFVPSVTSPQEGEDWTGKVGRVTSTVENHLKNAPESEAYLCGSPGMIDASIKVLKELGMSEDKIFYDKFEQQVKKMKESPQSKSLEEMLRSSKLVAGGFMGSDPRSLYEIIDSDLAEVARLGYTPEQLAGRMNEITQSAIPYLGDWMMFDNLRQARVDEAKGSLVCPWPHMGRFAKRVTIVEIIETGLTIQWSDLNIHLIAAHSFFEGRGAAFRLEPAELVKMIF